MARKSPEPLTVPDAAEQIDRTPAALYAAIGRGDLKCIEKFGRKLVEVAELKRYQRQTKTGRPRNGADKRA